MTCKRYKIQTAEAYSSGIRSNHKHANLIKSRSPQTILIYFNYARRVFFCSPEQKCVKRRAVLTIEAAVVIPVFLLISMSILGIMDLYRIQSMIRTSLHESAMELGMYACAQEYEQDSPIGVISSVVCAGYAQSRLPDMGKHVSVSLFGSSVRADKICLRATITYRIPISFIPLPALHLTNSSTVHCWTGRNETEIKAAKKSFGEMVYITENESVYHTASSCTHLELAIHQGTMDTVLGLRNAYGQKYHVCEKCGSSDGQGIVYYTEKGNSFHRSAACSGLKRSVKMVMLSEAEHLSKCERCQKREDAA